MIGRFYSIISKTSLIWNVSKSYISSRVGN